MRLHHVNLTHPPGAEDAARVFYTRLLGLPEIPKPPELRARGGVWFAIGEHALHLSVEPLVAESRRHIAIQVPDLEAFREKLQAAGVSTLEDVPFESMQRFHCRDPFGNRLEFLSQG